MAIKERELQYVVQGQAHERRHVITPASNGDFNRRRLDERGDRIPPSVSVVIPALNEDRTLPRVLDQLPACVHEVVVVDGNSSDRTVEVALGTRPDARIVRQPRRGKGDALRAGFSVCSGDAIVMLDADGSMSPAEIPMFVDALRSGAEFVKGSRFLPTAGSDDLTGLRKLGNHGFVTLFNALYRTSHSDLCYGYAAFWRRCLPALSFERDGFEVETLLNIRSAQAGLHIREVPSFEFSRQHGQSNLRVIRDGWHILRVLLAERLRAGTGQLTVRVDGARHTEPAMTFRTPEAVGSHDRKERAPEFATGDLAV
jgi:glycosyltransferase involved in cell wall biosynthesis